MAMAFAGRRGRGRGQGGPGPAIQGPDMAERDRRNLMDLIEEATVSPSKSLDVGLLQSIKGLVRASDANVHTAFETLYDKLKKNHSQVRYLAVLLIDELFTRSKLFRSLLVPKFEMFMLLTIGYRDDYPLPKPADRAALLRSISMEYVEKWNDMFGVHYKQVRLGYEYLKKTLRLQFPNLREAAALAERQRQEKEARTQALLKKKYDSLSLEFPELKAEIQSTVDQLAECYTILEPESVSVPKAEEPVLEPGLESLVFGEEDEYEEYGDSSLRRQLHEEFRADIAVPEKARETADNSVVFETLRDLYKIVMTSHLRSTQEWLSILMRVDVQDTRPRDVLLKEVIDLRNQLLNSRERCESLGIDHLEVGSTSKSLAEGDDDDDIIWEAGDTGMGIAEAESIAQAVKVEQESSNSRARSADVASTSAASQSKSRDMKEESRPRSELLKKAPVLPYGAFLDSWGAKADVPANQRGLQMDNHWGKFDSDAMIPADKIAELNVRSSYYKPPEREIPPCRAPLKKGGLCQRRDLHKCPLHGPIILRDEDGVPIVEAKESRGVESKAAGREAMKEVFDVTAPSSGSAVGLAEREVPPVVSQSALAAQAIANVRERDELDAKKKREERVMAKRGQSKRDREHNDAVLRSAALSHTPQGFQESFGEASEEVNTRGGKRRPRGGLTALLKKTPTAKDRIAQRLLNSRVRENALNELTWEEDARSRDAAANQWEMR